MSSFVGSGRWWEWHRYRSSVGGLPRYQWWGSGRPGPGLAAAPLSAVTRMALSQQPGPQPVLPQARPRTPSPQPGTVRQSPTTKVSFPRSPRISATRITPSEVTPPPHLQNPSVEARGWLLLGSSFRTRSTITMNEFDFQYRHLWYCFLELSHDRYGSSGDALLPTDGAGSSCAKLAELLPGLLVRAFGLDGLRRPPWHRGHGYG